MAAELPRPGVEVVQVFRSVSPTVVTPTLTPCIVGVCRQVVDVLVPNAAGASVLNTQAVVPLQAVFRAKDATGTPAVYTGLDTLLLVLSLGHGPDVTVTFSGASLTPAQVVAQILAAFSAAGVTAYTAEVVGSGFRIRSLAGNEFQTIDIRPLTSAAVATAFGTAIGKSYSGAAYYDQHITRISAPSFPDPNSNLAQLVVQPETVRAFLYLGGSGNGSALLEALRTESFLRNGLSTAGARTGTVDMTGLTYPTSLGTNTLTLKVDSGNTLTVTFANPANLAAALSQINAVIGAVATATTNASNFLVITSLTIGPSSRVEITGGTAAATLGLSLTGTSGVAGVVAIDSGNGTQVTGILEMVGATFTAAPTAAQLAGTADITSAGLFGAGGTLNNTTLILEDGNVQQTITFSAPANTAALLTALNALFGTAGGGVLTATQGGTGGNKLVLTSSVLGQESIVKVVGGTGASLLGLTAGAVARGNPYAPIAGDTLYVDGQYYGTITQVAPGGNAARVKIDQLVPISSNVGTAWYIVAKNLSASSAANGVTRPTPNLTVDTSANLLIKPEIMRDVRGNPVSPARGQIYIAYKALRLDVTAKAKSPGLLRFSDTTTLGSNLAPLTQDNPLGLGFYFALLNAPGTVVTGVGVDEVSTGSPFGTVAGFTRAATFLEAFEVYAIALMTHDPTVFQVFATHVSVMSAAENKGERIALINHSTPTNKLDTLVASGISGNTTSTANQFDTGIANLSPLLLANGLSGVGPYAVSAGIYLDIGDGKKYAVTNVTGSILTLKTASFLPGENDDGYYSTTTLPSPLINDTFAVRIRGAALVLSDGTVDKENLAIAMQQTAQSYANRRVWNVFPDKAAATLSGVEQVVEGFYMSAAIAGMIARQPPQQSFTNFPMTGFTRVIGSNDRFGERQLNVMAAGGNYIIVQDAPATPLISRMALTTEMTSIETRTDSITKVVDFTAKFLRTGLKNFIGRFNITQGFLDSLGHVLQGLLGFLVESGVLIGANLNNLVQDTDAPDTVLIDITLDVPFPCNYLRLTLVI